MILSPGSGTLTVLPEFIVLEGVNGAGKTTLQNHLASYLEENGREVVNTREPGGTPLGGAIRKLILERNEGELSTLAELFLFGADRADHVENCIKPALKEGKTVISDRYFYSTIAFQGHGRKIERDTIDAVNTLAISGVLPDLVILLDLDPAEGLKRNRDGNSERDAFEDEEIEFHTRIRNGFLEIARERPEPFLVINATQSEERVFEEVRTVLNRTIKNESA